MEHEAVHACDPGQYAWGQGSRKMQHETRLRCNGEGAFRNLLNAIVLDGDDDHIGVRRSPVLGSRRNMGDKLVARRLPNGSRQCFTSATPTDNGDSEHASYNRHLTAIINAVGCLRGMHGSRVN
jgi:hypothetical protein